MAVARASLLLMVLALAVPGLMAVQWPARTQLAVNALLLVTAAAAALDERRSGASHNRRPLRLGYGLTGAAAALSGFRLISGLGLSWITVEVLLRTLGVLALGVAFGRRGIEPARRSDLAALLKSTFDAVAEPIAVIDAGCRVAEVNWYAELRFGSGLVGELACETPYFSRASCTDCPIDRAFRERQPAFLREPGPNADPRTSVTSVPVAGGDGEVRYQVQHVTEAGRGGDTAPPAAGDEDIELHAERLRELGELSSELLHEINNPLAIIRGVSAELATAGGQVPRDRVVQIRDLAERCCEIIDALQRLARRGGALEQEAVSLAEVVERARALVDHLLQRSGIRVAVEIDADLPAVTGDATLLQQLLINLLVNARDAIASVRRRGSVAIRGRQRGGRVLLSVADDGPGIAEGDGERIFEPFVTSKAPGAGTGVGLALSRRIAERHGGMLTASNHAPRGAVFTLELPAAAAAAPRAAAVALPAAGRRLRVLAVDDEPAILAYARAALSAASCDVVAVGSAAEARAVALEDEPFDAAVLDIGLGEDSGIELANDLIARQPSLAGRIVFATGSLFTADRREEAELPAARYVTKPYSIERLVGAVREAAAVGAPETEPASDRAR